MSATNHIDPKSQQTSTTRPTTNSRNPPLPLPFSLSPKPNQTKPPFHCPNLPISQHPSLPATHSSSIPNQSFKNQFQPIIPPPANPAPPPTLAHSHRSSAQTGTPGGYLHHHPCPCPCSFTSPSYIPFLIPLPHISTSPSSSSSSSSLARNNISARLLLLLLLPPPEPPNLLSHHHHPPRSHPPPYPLRSPPHHHHLNPHLTPNPTPAPTCVSEKGPCAAMAWAGRGADGGIWRGLFV